MAETTLRLHRRAHRQDSSVEARPFKSHRTKPSISNLVFLWEESYWLCKWWLVRGISAGTGPFDAKSRRQQKLAVRFYAGLGWGYLAPAVM
ncbi:hypothetical protein ACLK17_25825 [Escherichia coli]